MSGRDGEYGRKIKTTAKMGYAESDMAQRK